MPMQPLQGLKAFEESFENFVTLNPDKLDEDLVNEIRNEIRFLKPQKKFTYPPPLIRVVSNGNFNRE